jgi:hypothetical protein
VSTLGAILDKNLKSAQSASGKREPEPTLDDDKLRAEFRRGVRETLRLLLNQISHVSSREVWPRALNLQHVLEAEELFPDERRFKTQVDLAAFFKVTKQSISKQSRAYRRWLKAQTRLTSHAEDGPGC